MIQEAKEAQQIEPETVRLGQRFKLFGPQKTLAKPFGELKTNIVLKTDTSTIKLTVMATNATDSTSDGFPVYLKTNLTPFAPEEGYQFTKEDYQLETQAAKTIKVTNESDPLSHQDLKKYLGLWVTTLRDDEMQNSDLYRDPADRKHFKPEVLEELKKMRFQLFFPTIMLEGRIPPNSLKDGRISIMAFSPSDLNRPIEDQPILIPNETEKLFQIEGAFVLAEEEPKRVK